MPGIICGMADFKIKRKDVFLSVCKRKGKGRIPGLFSEKKCGILKESVAEYIFSV